MRSETSRLQNVRLSERVHSVPRVLFVHNGRTRFVQTDIDLIRSEHSVSEWFVDSRHIDLDTAWRLVHKHDLVFGWFASWHTFLPMLFARLLGKPSILVVGGYDLARMP